MLNRALMFRGHNRDWYSLAAASNDTTEIMIYDEISWWGITADRLVTEIAKIETDNILVRVNSPGGDVFDATAIANALRDHKASVTVQIDSLAASAATIISMAGDTIRAHRNSFFMIHNPWTLAVGEAKDLRKTAELLEKIRDTIIGDYAAKAGSDTDWAAAMDAETWYSAQEAVDVGLIDSIIESEAPTAQNKMNLVMFNRVPEPLQAVEPAREDEAGIAFAAMAAAAARNRQLRLLMHEF